MVESWVEAQDGTKIAYRDHGAMATASCCSRAEGNLESMDQYAARLGDGRRCVAIDVRAPGQPGDPART